MCGRYASSRRPEDLVEEFEVQEVHVAVPLEPDYNVAPTKPVYAVLERPEREDHPQQRQLRTLTWGLIPSWAKDPSIGSRLINARSETLADKPAFRRAFASRRCLLPADGYYEWYPTQRLGARGKPVKQPFFISPRGGGVLAMAGLYEIWRDPDRSEDDAERFRWTCTVITTQAQDDVGHIHDRMPMLVEPGAWSQWLDPTVDVGRAGGALADLLVPAAPGLLQAWPVSPAVGNVRNNGPELARPLDAEPAADLQEAT